MKTKKVLSLITVFAIVATLFSAIPVSAANDRIPSNAPLGVNYNVNNWSGYTTEDFEITYANEAKEGSRSLSIENINEVDFRSLITKVPFKSAIKAGEKCKISFWIKSTDWEGRYMVGNDLSDEKVANFAITALNEWNYIETEWTPTMDITNIQFVTWKHQRYIDDVQVCKVNEDGTYGENVVFNNGFETVLNYDAATQLPSQWHGLPTGASVSTMIAQNTFIASTDMDSHSGDRSMLVNVEQEIANTRYHVSTYPVGGLKTGTNYRMELYFKPVSGNPVAHIADEDYLFAEEGRQIVNKAKWTAGDDGWYKVTHNFPGKKLVGDAIQFWFWLQGAMLIDDVTLYEVDANGNTTGANLIANGDMESYVDFNSAPTEGLVNTDWVVIQKIDNVVNPNSERKDFRRFVEVSEGNYAMEINYDDYERANTYASVQLANELSLSAGTNYTIEYDIKGSTGARNALAWHFLPSGNSGLVKYNTPSIFGAPAVTDLADGWRHCKASGPSSTGKTVLMMLMQGHTDVIVDNIVLYETADKNKTNLFPNGDFQNTYKQNRTDLANLVVYPVRKGGAATVSWTNATGTVEDITISVNGTVQDVVINEAETAFNEIYLDNLTPGETYEVVVSATVNGTEKVYTQTVVPYDVSDASAFEEMDFRFPGLGNYDSDEWSSYIRDGEGYANTVISVEDGAAKITGNIPEIKGNTYAGVEQTVTLDRGKLYQLTFKAKGKGVTAFQAVLDTKIASGSEFWVPESFGLAGNWHEYTMILDSINAAGEALYEVLEEGELYDAPILLMTEQYKGNVWIDDVEVCEIDPDTYEVIGDNLIVNGGFDAQGPVYGEPVLTKGTEVVNKLSAGNINVAVTVKNAEEIALLVALYKNGALYSVSAMEKSDVDSDLYDTNITVPNEGTFTAKVMYWTNVGSIAPVRPAAEFAE